MTDRLRVDTPKISFEGHLLVATPALDGTPYERSVCLVVRHQEDGVIGVFLNRAIESEANDLWEHLTGSEAAQRQLHLGGPESGPVVALHNCQELAEYTSGEGVYFAAQVSLLKQLVAHEGEDSNVKLIVGQNQWASGELEQQLLLGQWMMLPVKEDVVFAEGDDMWHKARRELGNLYVSSITGCHYRNAPSVLHN